MKGYTGKVLIVDLTRIKVSEVSPSKEWYQKYLGGKGLAFRYLIQDVPPRTEPFDPSNEIIFMTGPFAGTIIPTSSRLAIVTKSPHTGTVLISLVGGGAAAEIKYAGYDGIIVRGAASKPVCLVVTDKAVTLESATHLWGKGIHDTEQIIQNDKRFSGAKTMVIGPAGEHLVPFACITVDSYHQAGRGGSGAVMGSKNLKAIIVKGSRGVEVANAGTFLEFVRDVRNGDVLTNRNLWAHTDGTPMLVDVCQEVGIIPTRNFQDGQFSKANQINTDAVKKRQKTTRACQGCPLGCGRFTEADDGTQVEGPEYESIALAGSNCDMGSIDGLIRFHKRCDDFGVDVITAGAILGFAMEATERGFHDFGIRFGQEQVMLEYVEKISLKEGIGADLALGVRELARRIGAEAIAVEIKGLELPGYDPRGSYGQALAYATSERGACHMRAFAVEEDVFGHMDPFTFEGKAQVVKQKQDYNSAKDSMILCDFWNLSSELLAKIYTEVTGLPMTAEELMTCGERIWNMGRLFNIGAGFSRTDDYLPFRIQSEALIHGPAAGRVIPKDEFTKALLEFYALRGWDEDGQVVLATLVRLNMDQGVLDLAKDGERP